tara:strand:- start:365 stop:664 length:300 start_codon:yes stop_codon:yes gene_type:complete
MTNMRDKIAEIVSEADCSDDRGCGSGVLDPDGIADAIMELVQARIDTLEKVISRKTNTIAFALNHIDTKNFYDKLLRELEQDREALKETDTWEPIGGEA